MSEDELELDKIGGYKQINTDTGEEEIITKKTVLFIIIYDTDSSFKTGSGLLKKRVSRFFYDGKNERVILKVHQAW